MNGSPTAGAVRSGRLDWVEVGRGLAAFAVVVFHANASARYFGGPSWASLNFLAHGVDFFFVLSGFVILHAHEKDLGRRERLSSYVLKRAVRLLPTLWIVVLGWALLRWSMGVGSSAAVLLGSLLPFPSSLSTIPPVVWTLRHELVFYVLFATLIASRRAGMVLLAAWLLLIVVQTVAGVIERPLTGLPAFLLAGYSADFMLGMGVYLVQRQWPARASPVPLAFGVVLLTLISLVWGQNRFSRVALQDYQSDAATWGAVVLGIGFACVLYGLVRLEGCVKAPRPLLALGTISYALYLVHTPVNSAAQVAARALPVPMKAVGAGHLLLIAAGIAIAWVLHRCYERPVMHWLRTVTGLHQLAEAKPDSQSTVAPGLR